MPVHSDSATIFISIQILYIFYVYIEVGGTDLSLPSSLVTSWCG